MKTRAEIRAEFRQLSTEDRIEAFVSVVLDNEAMRDELNLRDEYIRAHLEDIEELKQEIEYLKGRK